MKTTKITKKSTLLLIVILLTLAFAQLERKAGATGYAANAAETPPAGKYSCHYWGYDYSPYGTGYKMNTSSLTEISILPKQKMKIVGETVGFSYKNSLLTLLEGKFEGATAHYKMDSDGKPAIVFVRKENEPKGHKIDVSDTWCYLEQ